MGWPHGCDLGWGSRPTLHGMQGVRGSNPSAPPPRIRSSTAVSRPASARRLLPLNRLGAHLGHEGQRHRQRSAITATTRACMGRGACRSRWSRSLPAAATRGLVDTPQVVGGRRGAGAAGECRCCHPGPGNTRSSGRSHPDRPLRCAGSTEIPPALAFLGLHKPASPTRSRRGPGRPGIWILIRQQSHAMGTLFDLRGHRMADTCGHGRCSR